MKSTSRSCHSGVMSETDAAPRTVVVVTGANGFVGSRICAALVDRARPCVPSCDARHRPAARGCRGVGRRLLRPRPRGQGGAGATAVVTTVHPMGTDRETQHRIAVEGTPVLARAARDAGVRRLVHISTAAVYDRSPGVGDVDEASPLVADDANAYAVTKRDTDAALADIDGMTRVILRPPAILGSGESSIWNSLRPADIRDDERARHAVPGQSFAWVHVDDLVALAADVAVGPRRDVHRPRGGTGRGTVARSSTSPQARPRRVTTTRRSPGLSVSSRSGTRPRVDRPHPGRARPRVGLGPDRGPGAGARRDRRGTAHPRAVTLRTRHCVLSGRLGLPGEAGCVIPPRLAGQRTYRRATTRPAGAQPRIGRDPAGVARGPRCVSSALALVEGRYGRVGVCRVGRTDRLVSEWAPWTLSRPPA